MMREVKIGTTVISIVFLALASGCHTYRIQAPGQVGVTQHRECVWALAWGLLSEQPLVDDCHGQAIAEVVVRSNLLFDVISVATLGGVSPKIIEWKCAPASPSVGEFTQSGDTSAPLVVNVSHGTLDHAGGATQLPSEEGGAQSDE